MKENIFKPIHRLHILILQYSDINDMKSIQFDITILFNQKRCDN